MKTAEEILREEFANSFLDLEYIDLHISAMEKYAEQFKQKLNIASVVRPVVESAKEGELLPVEGLAKSVCGGVIIECEKCGEKIQWPVTSTICEKCV